MRPDTSKLRRHDFITYDLEWYPRTYKLRLVGARDERGYRSYHTVEAFLQRELCPQNSGRRFYAHAGGLADIAFILAPLLKGGYYCSGAFSGSSLVMLEARKGRFSWTFVDSLWTLREKLAVIGESIGFPKLEVDFETENEKELRTYNERDCLILWRALDRLQEQLNDMGGELRLTLASCALDLFRRRYLDRDIAVNPDVNMLAREGYIASRVEVFRYSCPVGYYFDINSSFPASGSVGPLPGALIGETKTIPDEGLFITRAKVKVPECEYPPLPYRQNGRVCHPTGTWTGVFTRDDLTMLAMSGGKVVSVERTMLFDELWCLKPFFDDVYRKRCSFKKGSYEYLVYKLLLNSLYGKFAERSVKAQLLLDPLTTEGLEHMIMPGVWLRPKTAELKHEHPVISQAITARSRLALYRLILDSAPSYYCDTDAVIGSVEHEESDELGGLKLEGVWREGDHIRPKLYRGELQKPGGQAKETVKAKGFRGMTYEEFSRVQHGFYVKRERMLRAREMIRSGNLKPREAEQNKGLRFEYVPNRCRLPMSDLTRPWTVRELDRMADKSMRIKPVPRED